MMSEITWRSQSNRDLSTCQRQNDAEAADIPNGCDYVAVGCLGGNEKTANPSLQYHGGEITTAAFHAVIQITWVQSNIENSAAVNV